jgi:hypothetical protein
MNFVVALPHNRIELTYREGWYQIKFDRKPIRLVLDHVRDIKNVRWRHDIKTWEMKGKSIITWRRLYEFMGWLIGNEYQWTQVVVEASGTHNWETRKESRTFNK